MRLVFSIEKTFKLCAICVVICTLTESPSIFESPLIRIYLIVLNSPLQFSRSVRLPILKSSNILLVFCKNQNSLAVGLTLPECPSVLFESPTFWPGAYSLPVRKVVLELSLVFGPFAIDNHPFHYSLPIFQDPIVSQEIHGINHRPDLLSNSHDLTV